MISGDPRPSRWQWDHPLLLRVIWSPPHGDGGVWLSPRHLIGWVLQSVDQEEWEGTVKETFVQLRLDKAPYPLPLSPYGLFLLHLGLHLVGDSCLAGSHTSSGWHYIQSNYSLFDNVFVTFFPVYVYVHCLILKVHTANGSPCKGNCTRRLVFGWMATWQNVELSVHLSPGGRHWFSIVTPTLYPGCGIRCPVVLIQDLIGTISAACIVHLLLILRVFASIYLFQPVTKVPSSPN